MVEFQTSTKEVILWVGGPQAHSVIASPLSAWEWDKRCLLGGAKHSGWGCESPAGHTGT